MNGRIVGISGSTVRTDLTELKLYERVLVGHRQLTGEVVRIETDVAVIQIYEESRGLAMGEPVTGLGRPLSVTLGPGMLGQIYDGLQRPLKQLKELTGPFLQTTRDVPPFDLQHSFQHQLTVKPGDLVEAWECIGSVREGLFAHPVYVPEGVAGRVSRIAAASQPLADPVCVLEDGTGIYAYHTWPVRTARPCRKKLKPSRPVVTGQRIIDFLFPFARGGTVIIPGGFGAGKTILEQTIAKFADVDIVIYVGCGERGNEMSELIEDFRHLTDLQTGRPLGERTIQVVNTSNMPVAARESSIHTAVTMGEYYRDLGCDVLLLADSLSRWAEALREISSSLEEMPGEEGYPTYLASALASFCERAGVVETMGGRTGSLSMVLSASPPGEDFTEPVTQSLLRTCGTLLMLDSSLAHARHFPAINWSHSYSLYENLLLPSFVESTSEEWLTLRHYCHDVLRREDALKEIVEIVGIEGLQDRDRLLMHAAEMLRSRFLGQSVFSREAYSSPTKTLAVIKEIAAWHDRGESRLAENKPLHEVLKESAPYER